MKMGVMLKNTLHLVLVIGNCYMMASSVPPHCVVADIGVLPVGDW